MLSPKLIYVVLAATAAFGLCACETVTVKTDSAHDIISGRLPYLRLRQ